MEEWIIILQYTLYCGLDMKLAVRMLYKVYVYVTMVLSHVYTYNQQHIFQYREKLMEVLFQNQQYRKEIIPQMTNDSLIVDMSGNVVSILDVNERDQILITKAFFSVKWTDQRLEWKPENHGGIQEIHLEPILMWKPDIMVENEVTDNSPYLKDLDAATLVHIYHTGLVLAEYMVKLATSCVIDTAFYPFDTQRCNIYISSWMYSTDYLSLMWTKVDESNNFEYINTGWNKEYISLWEK